MQDERVLKAGILSKSTNYRLLVDGPVSAKEIDRLIAQLELDKDILADCDSDKVSLPQSLSQHIK